MFIKRIKDFLPRFPRKRYNIFTGTVSFAQWLKILKIWIIKPNIDDESIIENYEDKFSKIVGTKYGVSFGSGRMALFSILKALDIKSGDEVIIPAFSCVVVPNAFIYSGVKPIYVDIRMTDFNIDINEIKNAISKKTRAIYAQHTFGVPCNIEEINKLADQYNLKVIEDGAHALGGIVDGVKIGSFSDVAFFSTDHSKTITTYLGGIATTNDTKIAQNLKKIQSQSPFLSKKETFKIIRSLVFEYIYFSPYFLWIGLIIHKAFIKLRLNFAFKDEMRITKPDKYPYPCRLSSLQASVGLDQLNTLENNLIHRRHISLWLESKIKWYKFDENEINDISWIRYSFLVKDRSKFIEKFSKTFDLGIWFTSIFGGRDSDFSEIGYKENSCPRAEFVSRHIVNFPTHQRIPISVIKKEIGPNINWIKRQIIKD